MRETYVCAPDHSKNIFNNRPWNAIKTHAVVVCNTRALGEYSSTVFQPSSDLSTNKIDFCEQWSTFWYRLLSFVNCVLFKVCLRFVQGIVRFFSSETSYFLSVVRQRLRHNWASIPPSWPNNNLLYDWKIQTIKLPVLFWLNFSR